MKILISTGIYPPDIGGPATYSKLLYDEFPKKEINVEVLSFGEVRNLPKILRHIVFIYKLVKKVKGIDIIFAQDTVSVGFPSFIVSKVFRKKFFVRVPGDHAWEQAYQRFGVKDSIDDFQNKKYSIKVEFLRKIQKITVNGANVVITPSLYFKNLVSKWVKNPNKVYCIYNGIDLSIIKNVSNKVESKTIVSAGRLVPWKGFDILIKIMKDLRDWKLFICGDGPIRKDLELYAKKENVEDRVFFLGQVKKENLIELLQKSEIFVLNTSFESFSFQVVEAMASGIPVITTNIGNLSEIIENGKSGILVNLNDEEAIISSIKKLSSDLILRKNIIEEAKKKAQFFSIENTLNNLLNLIKLSL